MAFKIACCAGHYLGTPGKRVPKTLDPNETREWTLNGMILETQTFTEWIKQVESIK